MLIHIEDEPGHHELDKVISDGVAFADGLFQVFEPDDPIVESSIASMYILLGFFHHHALEGGDHLVFEEKLRVISLPFSLMKYPLRQPLMTRNSFVAISPSDRRIVPAGISRKMMQLWNLSKSSIQREAVSTIGPYSFFSSSVIVIFLKEETHHSENQYGQPGCSSCFKACDDISLARRLRSPLSRYQVLPIASIAGNRHIGQDDSMYLPPGSGSAFTLRAGSSRTSATITPLHRRASPELFRPNRRSPYSRESGSSA